MDSRLFRHRPLARGLCLAALCLAGAAAQANITAAPSVLTFNLKVLGFGSAGLANLCAAVVGITSSFLGSRFYVFAASARQPWLPQAIKFSGLYGAIALLHGLVLWLWTDRLGLDYRAGFLLATGLQVSLSYLGNKFLVFKPS